jgi:hypothetical protein
MNRFEIELLNEAEYAAWHAVPQGSCDATLEVLVAERRDAVPARVVVERACDTGPGPVTAVRVADVPLTGVGRFSLALGAGCLGRMARAHIDESLEPAPRGVRVLLRGLCP